MIKHLKRKQSQKRTIENKIKTHDNKYFKCEQCDYSAHQNSTLMTHVRIVHDKLERFACKICPFATAVKVNLEYHMIKEHGVDKPYKCNECNYECITKQNIEKHVQSVHNKIKNYKCEFCKFATKIKYELVRHTRRKHPNGSSDPALPDLQNTPKKRKPRRNKNELVATENIDSETLTKDLEKRTIENKIKERNPWQQSPKVKFRGIY